MNKTRLQILKALTIKIKKKQHINKISFTTGINGPKGLSKLT